MRSIELHMINHASIEAPKGVMCESETGVSMADQYRKKLGSVSLNDLKIFLLITWGKFT